MAQGFNLTANLTIKATNLGNVVKNIKTAFSSIKAEVTIGANYTELQKAEKQVTDLQKLISDHSKWNINLKVGTPTQKQIGNLDKLKIALTSLEPILTKMSNTPYNIGVNFAGLGNKNDIRDTAKALNMLEKSVTKFGNAKNITLNLSGNIKTVLPDLHKLNTVLKSKVVDLNAFKSAAESAGKSLLGIGTYTNRAVDKINKTGKAAKDSGQAAHEATNFWYEFGKSGGLAVKRFGAFTIATSVVFGLVNAISEATREAIDFERQLAKIAQISNTTIKGVRDVADNVGNLAIKYGIASKSLLEVNQVFAQAGLKGYELQRALEAIAKSDLAPTFIDMQNTGEGLIAMMGQFKIQADDYERALGSINQVSADFAVESDDLITAIRIFGGVFANASQQTKPGLRQMQELLAIFTGIRDTTRESAESISTGLRTIITRIQRPRTISFLKQYNIDLDDAQGNFIGVYEAVQQLNRGLSGLNKNSSDYARISEEIGGYRQKGKTVPLLQELPKIEKALASALSGGDSLDTQIGTQLETIGRKVTQLAESFKKLIREIVASSTFQLITDSLLGMADAFIKVAESVKPLLPLLASFLAIRGFIAGKEFIKGGVAQLMHTPGSVVGAGLKRASKGGLSGFSGGVSNIPGYGLYTGVKNIVQQRGGFQGIASGFDSNSRMLSADKFYNRALSKINVNYLNPALKESLNKVYYKMAKDFESAFGNSSKKYHAAMSASTKYLVSAINDSRNQIALPLLQAKASSVGVGAGMNMPRDFKKLKFYGGMAANIASSLAPIGMIGGMALSSMAEDSPVLSGAGKVLSGTAIGAMIGSTFGPIGTGIGAAGGLLISSIKAVADALGPESIERANKKISKQLNDFADLQKDFYNNMTIANSGEFAGGIENSYRQINDAISSSGEQIKKISKTGGISGFFGIGWDNFWKSITIPKNKQDSITRNGANITQQDKSILTNYNDLVTEQVKTGLQGVEKLSVPFTRVTEQMFRKYGKIAEGGQFNTEGAILLKSDLNFDDEKIRKYISNLAFTGTEKENLKAFEYISAGSTEEERMLRLQQKGYERFIALQNKFFELTKSAEDAIFIFDSLRLSLERLGAVSQKISEQNKNAANYTDQLFSSVLTGPASNNILMQERINPFRNVDAYLPEQITAEAIKLGITTSNGRIAKDLYYGLGIKERLPQLAGQAQGLPAIEARTLLENALIDPNGRGDNPFADMIQGAIDKLTTAEGQGLKYEDIMKEVLDPIMKIVEQETKVLADEYERRVENIKRITEIVGKNLEIEEKLRKTETETIQRRLANRERVANLFFEEDAATKGKRLMRERTAITNNVFGGPNQNNLLSLLQRRTELRSQLNNANLDDLATKELQQQLFENQNEINKNTEQLSFLADTTKQLANIEQQVLQIQKKREAGRDLMKRINSMSPTEIMQYISGGMLSATMTPNTQLSQGQFGELFNFYDLLNTGLDSLTPEQRKAVEKTMSTGYSAFGNIVTQGTSPDGAYTGIVRAGGTIRGGTPQEVALEQNMKDVNKIADSAIRNLEEATKYELEQAKLAYEREKQLVDSNKDFIVQKANNVYILRPDSYQSEDSNNIPAYVPNTRPDLGVSNRPASNFVFEKGGRLGGTGAIPIVAHGGELIIPKNKVDKGLGGVMEFAKSQGLMFKDGGVVPPANISSMSPEKFREQRGFYIDQVMAGSRYNDPSKWEQIYNNLIARGFNPTKESPDEFLARKNEENRQARLKNQITYTRGNITPEMEMLRHENLAGPGRFISYQPNAAVNRGAPSVVGFSSVPIQRESVAAPLREQEKRLAETRIAAQNAVTGLVPDDELARMRVLGQFAWGILNSGTLDSTPGAKEKLQRLLTSGAADINTLRDRERQIREIVYNPRTVQPRRGGSPVDDVMNIPLFANGTPLVTRTGMAQIHKGEAIVPAKANPNNNQNNNIATEFNNLDKAVTKMADVLSKISIPEKITLEISQINHVVTFNGGDILTEQIANRVAERANQLIQKQIANVISPLTGEVLQG